MSKKNILTFIIVILISLFYCNLTLAVDKTALEGAMSKSILFKDKAGLTYSDPQDLIIGTIKLILATLSIIFFILIIVSGLKWMTSGGDSQTIEKARKTISNSVIGLAIILGSYIIFSFVTKALDLAINNILK